MPAPVEENGKEKKNAEAKELFLKIGLEDKTAQNAVANPKVTANLIAVIVEAGLQEGCGRSVGNLLYSIATKFPNNALNHRPTLLQYVTAGKIKSIPQVEAAFGFLSKFGPEPYNLAEFESACGVGVEVSQEEIQAAVKAVIEKQKDMLLQQRYRANVGILLSHVRAEQPWADGKVVKEEMDAQLKQLLGEKTAEDEKPLVRKKEKKPRADPKSEEVTSSVGDTTAVSPAAEENDGNAKIDPFSIFPSPEENNAVLTEIFFSDGSIWRPHNTKERLEKHLEVTGKKVHTRFPPEPNGYLHIGHAKAMYVDFGLAKDRGGNCYLRFDDTNPEAEKKEYIDHIQEIINWIGWQPFKITYSSDYFQQLYDLAVELIKRDCAYVDHQTAEEIKLSRLNKEDSPWRNRPISESLKLFDDMRRGLIDEGKATLRMKQDMKNDNKNMGDLIAYRIKFTPHPHVGDKWCIYPSYDYTHCIVDSLENITHSLCTLEFESRRASYYWLLESLDLYLPYVWEYSRLNITHNVMSKRKLNELVTNKHVDGWEDPRLITLAGLRRRGASPEAIQAFCRGVGITRSDNLIRTELLEHFMRDDLNRNAPRSLVVLKPLKVVITNMDENTVEELEAKPWPEAKEGDRAKETYKIPFSRVIYIEQSDFRLKDSKDYYGLAPNKSVMLRYAYPIKCTDVIYGEDKETVVEIHAEYDRAKSTKPKVIHWVAEPAPGVNPLNVEIRLFDKLFKSENPAELEDWLGDLNPNSIETITTALAVPALKDAPVGSKFQFERLGYFCVDTDTTPEKMVFNRTVTLRDSYPKSLGK
ncbi:glutaminyl-tRNA synthetase [Marchantia polymorpha subsp. ruderalis]|uniref:glutamine--tRNA ligase n=2 Tax=Marchantia polymorpha TaxID=3197 RepID=A0A176VVR5_MARPO|nr:hypothetical protein AXG93_1615s1570 [Marchantia polymorpha subsp. ruderalis]PTQ40549.1 hypothetical protein MARPO_0039s0055 [Marchantia polymorpha]BBN05975.1 hypothetical protein Mp_3g17390 [Marchantia polymorpha subsp. ruderalis]|eukprot:PTQ40549.1 hypothetical protein MARPO_0039s0055 [Marchantia polymorpha]